MKSKFDSSFIYAINFRFAKVRSILQIIPIYQNFKLLSFIAKIGFMSYSLHGLAVA